VISVIEIEPLDHSDEAISAAVQRFHESGTLGIIAERGAQAFDRRVQPVLEVDERAVRPQPASELLTRQNFCRPFEQDRQQLEWLILQADPNAVLP
jgi:hypothetical protein